MQGMKEGKGRIAMSIGKVSAHDEVPGEDVMEGHVVEGGAGIKEGTAGAIHVDEEVE